ncbi:MAG: hypothetical protein HYR56_34620 [Acidobacteria bacterium]|nr:hypothetical protein [Acidobacteriota bacterium]MBI3423605.1 hypothetical protein [Acidobacteriota bacterium]
MDFAVELAASGDDLAIRHLLAHNPVPGRITVSFEREPEYFAGCATLGQNCQVLVAHAMPNEGAGEVVGVACRASRAVFVNGRAERLGYLGQLRVAQAQRGRWLVSRGFRFLKQLHEADPLPAYLVSLIEGNTEALGVLVSQRRPHFPEFRALGRLYTLALALGRMKPALQCQADITTATAADAPAIAAFLQQHGARRQFYQVWQTQDLLGGPATLGFRIEDLFVARRDGAIVGVLGLWDQSAYKQTVVRGYAPGLRVAKPFYNAWARLRGGPRLPPIGAEIRYGYAAFVCIADDDVEIFQALLRALYNSAVRRGHDYLMIGLAERDALLPAARAYAHIAYPSQLYLAFWEGGEEFYARLDDRTPWLEIATL